jgi:hypothetical protein
MSKNTKALIKWVLIATTFYLAYHWYVASKAAAAAKKPTVGPLPPDAGVTSATGLTSLPANDQNTPAVTSIVFDDSEADTVWGGAPTAGAR